MTKARAGTLLALGLMLSMSACDGGDQATVTSSPATSVPTSEAITTTRTVKILSETYDSRKRTIGFEAERGRTRISYKLSDPGSITILVVDPQGKIIDGMDDRGSGDGNFELEFDAPGDYALQVSNPKRVTYRIGVSQRITD